MSKSVKLLIAVVAISSITAILLSCSKSKPEPSHRVVILGNSITFSPESPSIGWNGNWGMAASSADSDYVHLLTKLFKSSNSSNEVMVKNIAAFETGFDSYDLKANLGELHDFDPDILILRIGENVTRKGDSVLFEQKYVELINYFRSKSPDLALLAVGSVWPKREMSDRVLSRHSSYVSMKAMHSDLSSFAFGLFADPGVQSHPSNKGMRYISDRSWEALKKLIPDL